MTNLEDTNMGDFSLPREPACPAIQEPGKPLKVGEGLGTRTSIKVDPDSVVKQDPRLPDAGGKPNF